MSGYEKDFEEIAHCGGQATFHVRCDNDGRIGVAAGFRHSSPGPASFVGVYALAPHGIPVADFAIGGIGQGSNPPPEGCLPVFLGSDSQTRWGHECPKCEKHFRNGVHPAVYPLTCPYCGLKADAFRFLTAAQRRFVQHYVETYIRAFDDDMSPGTESEIVIDMDAIAKEGDNSERPDFYYSSESQQTRFECISCGDFNDIRGVFGYCASCGRRNNEDWIRRRLSTIRADLNAGKSSPSDSVRSAVSAFDAGCRDFAVQLKARIPMKAGRLNRLERLVFHDIDSPNLAEIKAAFEVDLLRGVSDLDRDFLRMMFERRHLYEHSEGVVDARYADRSGDKQYRIGDVVRETRENAHKLANILGKMTENFDKDFHEIFPLTEWPVQYFEERRGKRPSTWFGKPPPSQPPPRSDSL